MKSRLFILSFIALTVFVSGVFLINSTSFKNKFSFANSDEALSIVATAKCASGDIDFNNTKTSDIGKLMIEGTNVPLDGLANATNQGSGQISFTTFAVKVYYRISKVEIFSRQTKTDFELSQTFSAKTTDENNREQIVGSIDLTSDTDYRIDVYFELASFDLTIKSEYANTSAREPVSGLIEETLHALGGVSSIKLGDNLVLQNNVVATDGVRFVYAEILNAVHPLTNSNWTEVNFSINTNPTSGDIESHSFSIDITERILNFLTSEGLVIIGVYSKTVEVDILFHNFAEIKSADTMFNPSFSLTAISPFVLFGPEIALVEQKNHDDFTDKTVLFDINTSLSINALPYTGYYEFERFSIGSQFLYNGAVITIDAKTTIQIHYKPRGYQVSYLGRELGEDKNVDLENSIINALGINDTIHLFDKISSITFSNPSIEEHSHSGFSVLRKTKNSSFSVYDPISVILDKNLTSEDFNNYLIDGTFTIVVDFEPLYALNIVGDNFTLNDITFEIKIDNNWETVYLTESNFFPPGETIKITAKNLTFFNFQSFGGISTSTETTQNKYEVKIVTQRFKRDIFLYFISKPYKVANENEDIIFNKNTYSIGDEIEITFLVPKNKELKDVLIQNKDCTVFGATINKETRTLSFVLTTDLFVNFPSLLNTNGELNLDLQVKTSMSKELRLKILIPCITIPVFTIIIFLFIVINENRKKFILEKLNTKLAEEIKLDIDEGNSSETTITDDKNSTGK